MIYLIEVRTERHDLVKLKDWSHKEKLGVKFVVFSDIHNRYDLLESELLPLIEAEKPDFCLFLGDLLSKVSQRKPKPEVVSALTDAFSKLTEKVPVYAVMGNHDVGNEKFVYSVYKKSGVHLLENQGVRLNKNGKTYELVGLDDCSFALDKPQKCLSSKKEKKRNHPVIVFSHNPDAKGSLSNFHWDLLLSGHTHGGQIVLPVLGAPFIQSERHYASGFYPWDGRLLYINRGLGEHYRLRINCPREITIFEF